MMKNYDQSVEINHNLNWCYIPDYPSRILIVGGWGAWKTNVLLFGKKQQHFLNAAFRSYYDLFQIN